MTLEDFEKQLAADKGSSRRLEHNGHRSSHRSHSDEHGKHHHLHQSSKSREHDDRHDRHDKHRSKRRRRDEDDERRERRHEHKHRTDDSSTNPHEIETATKSSRSSPRPNLDHLKRDSWMEAPAALEIDYVQRKRPAQSTPPAKSLGADFEMKIHRNELNQHLRDLRDGKKLDDITTDTFAQEVDYRIGDAGSQWRMTKLKAVWRKANETGKSVDEVGLESYGNLKDFDNAREEEIELERREAYGKGYVGKDKPHGDLYLERGLKDGEEGLSPPYENEDLRDETNQVVEGIAVPSAVASGTGIKVDQTTLNRLKAQLVKAQLKKAPNLALLQEEYDQAVASYNLQDPSVVTLSAMDNRMLSSALRSEVKAVSNRRGAERGNVEENEDMSIEDMIREERRTKHQAGGEAQRFAERIAKDGKFDNDLEYMDENANQLAKRVHKSDMNLRNMTINEYQKMNKILESCPLCHREDTDTPPIAPVVSLATRTYLTLPTEPELSPFGAMIVPVEHRVNLLECDDDEWEEIRNFMKSLTRMYHDQGRDVIFYENAARPQRKGHAALTAVSLPYSQGDTAPAFFKEAFLTTEDEWSQHKKIIDTLSKSKQGLGKMAFRRTLAKEMPYFHVWFEMDGGLGHIVEDANRWPRGDLFAREIIGGMLGCEPDVIKRQGRWHRGHDTRLEGFRKKWRKFDWTRVLSDG